MNIEQIKEECEKIAELQYVIKQRSMVYQPDLKEAAADYYECKDRQCLFHLPYKIWAIIRDKYLQEQESLREIG